MSPRVLVPVVLVAVFTALALWVGSHLERVDEEIDLGYRGEAARNPHLAAGRFLRRMGVEAVELPAHRWIERPPPGPALLWLASPRHGVSGRRLEGLLAWVAEGNRLLVAGRRGDQGDPLLAALGVSVQTLGRGTGGDPVTVYTPRRDLAVRFGPGVRFRADVPGAEALAADDHGVAVLTLTHGAGRVTLLASREPFTNRHLGDADHGEALLALVAEGELPVWLVVDEAGPSLFAWLWRRLPALPVGLAALLALFLWQRIPRLGPAADLPDPARRSLLEHVTAAGWYLWRNQGRGHLLAAAREALERRAATRHPRYRELPVAERARLVARLSGTPVAGVRAALETPAHLHRDAFVAAVSQLETIRKRI